VVELRDLRQVNCICHILFFFGPQKYKKKV